MSEKASTVSHPLLVACVVTYCPDAAVRQRIEAIAKQVDHVVVVDNTPQGCTLKSDAVNMTLRLNRNRGAIAGALNVGLEFARTRGYRYLIVFDQDTEIPADLCGRLVTCAMSSPEAGIVGPRFLNSSTGHPGRIVSMDGMCRRSVWPSRHDAPFDALYLINTCSLLVLERIPPNLCYDESLIMDYVDVDFCLALRRSGTLIRCFPQISVRHGLGARTKGGREFSTTNYSPLRKYLQARNRVVVWRRYAREHPGFVLQDMVVWILDSVRTITLEPQRFAKLGAIVRGFWVGVVSTGDRRVNSCDPSGDTLC